MCITFSFCFSPGDEVLAIGGDLGKKGTSGELGVDGWAMIGGGMTLEWEPDEAGEASLDAEPTGCLEIGDDFAPLAGITGEATRSAFTVVGVRTRDGGLIVAAGVEAGAATAGDDG